MLTIRIITEADTAVLGAVIEVAIKETGNHNLKTILNKCSMNKIPELLFTDMEDIETFVTQEKERTHEVYKKWGFYCSMYEFYDDANRSRMWLLEHNKNLAKQIGYTYSSVYNEVAILIKNGFITKSSDSWHSLKIDTRCLQMLELV